ncbi:MAG: A/G-specific adenine glycosylase [Candidatus Binatia bacterium]|nr:A/G-specific adenine glycosylase [Candidatus Binatia bacterium]
MLRRMGSRPTAVARVRVGGEELLDPLSEDFVVWLRRRLLRWYRQQARPWPWRASSNPYQVWIAEVMLQQTRVEVVATAFPRFVARFPSLEGLAAADTEEVVAAWSGLGYYARARNLHRAARWLVQHGYREFPRDPAVAQKLPGVGSYTAAAVLSIAYGKPIPALDANVRRVLRRLLGRESATGTAIIQRAAARLLARRAPGNWNQALMELGQRICTPRTAQCERCPWKARCPSAGSAAQILAGAPPVGVRRSEPVIELVVDLVFAPTGQLLVERGAFPYLRHLWMPIVRERGRDNREQDVGQALVLGSFHHAIVKRRFRAEVRARSESPKKIERWLRAAPPGSERRLVTAGELQRLGRSSLLLKAWQLWERSSGEVLLRTTLA